MSTHLHRPVDARRTRNPPEELCARVKADPFVQLRLLDLQALDTTLDQLAHRRRHAARDRRAGVARRAAGRRCATSIVRVSTEDHDLGREQSKIETDVELVATRAKRDQQRLDSGAITSPKELENLQHEIGSLEPSPGRPRGPGARGDGEARGGAGSARDPHPPARRADGGCASRRSSARPRRSPPSTPTAAKASDERGDPRRDHPRRPAGAVREGARDQRRHRRGRALPRRAARAATCRCPARTSPSVRDAPSDEVRALRGVPAHPDPYGRVRAVTLFDSSAPERRVTVEADGGSRGNPGPGGLRRGRARAGHGGGAGRGGRVAGHGDQQRRGVPRADRRARRRAGPRRHPRRRPDGLQARRRADVGSLADQAPGHETPCAAGKVSWYGSSSG